MRKVVERAAKKVVTLSLVVLRSFLLLACALCLSGCWVFKLFSFNFEKRKVEVPSYERNETSVVPFLITTYRKEAEAELIRFLQKHNAGPFLKRK